ncbi:shootin-1 [Aplochiton taeniatus]
MAAEEEMKKIDIIADLSSQAVQEYEVLQRRHDRAAMECKHMQAERDEAVKRLSEFERVSHMVIAEVNTVQENLDIERTCRQSVEALASKLSRQNRSLKRKSMMLLAHLGPESLAEINLGEEEEEEEGEEAKEGGNVQSSDEANFTDRLQLTISELQNKLQLTLEDKKQATLSLEAAREQLKDIWAELLKEKHDNTVLIAETVRQKKLLAKYNRVSLFAVDEYETLQENLNLERDLRVEAESFAREMLVEQKKLNRQSQILLQSRDPAEALQTALRDVTTVTQELERQRLEHQLQLKQMDERLKGCELRKELTALGVKLELLEEEKGEYKERCFKAEVEVKDLRFTVEQLEKKLQAAINPRPSPIAPPPPPPPPPPLPPPPAQTSNPLSALLSMIRKKRDVDNGIPLVVQDSAKNPELDVRQQAVDEMMQRIKKGISLRPVGQTPNRTKQIQRLPTNTAIQELKGIMGNFKRPSPQPEAESPSTDSAAELEKILLKRRGVLEATEDISSKFGLF